MTSCSRAHQRCRNTARSSSWIASRSCSSKRSGSPAGHGSAAPVLPGHSHRCRRWPVPRRRGRGRWRSTGGGWEDRSMPVKHRCGSATAHSRLLPALKPAGAQPGPRSGRAPISRRAMRPLRSPTTRFCAGMPARSANFSAASRSPARARSPKSSRTAPGRWATQRSASPLPSAWACRIGPQAVSRTGSSTSAWPATAIRSSCTVTSALAGSER